MLMIMATYARVISGFPGIGKTRLSKDDRYKVLDSDSSNFSWIVTENGKERNPDFPSNYIQHIKDNLEKCDLILVSSHKQVRDELVKNEIEFALIYPDISLKQEYLQRYTDRDDSPEFITMMNDKWEEFIQECKEQEDCTPLVLQQGQYLSDYFIDKLPSSTEILAYLYNLAKENDLEVFIFQGEELKQYYDLPEGMGVATVAKTKDNAIVNLKAQRYSWMLQD